MNTLKNGFASLALLGLVSVGAWANHTDLKEKITLRNKIWVNGTEVKPGNYVVRYNASSGEMALERSGKVIAQAKATVIHHEEKFKQDALLTRGSEDAVQLTGVRLGGQHEEIQLVDTNASL